MKLLRWSRRENVKKFEDYTTWSLYLVLCMIPLTFAQFNAPLAAVNQPLTTVFWIGVLAETGTAIAVVRDAAIALREQRPQSRSLLAAAGGIGLVTLGVAATLIRRSGNTQDEALWIPLVVVGCAVGVASTAFTRRQFAALFGSGIAIILACWMYVGLPTDKLLGHTIGMVFFLATATISIRASFAMLRLMHEIDRSRAVASRLAVAEERLRFARDLHDTLGRNMSAIALKSQLAKQLVTRDANASEQEMGAVQQLAEESLSEMRAVVQGYRDVDLSAELRGAQSLLRSANIDSQIEVEPADLPRELHAGVGWVVREAVTNVIRHSSATTCTITAAPYDAGFTVRVTNDRPNPDRGGASGTGISGLGQRIAPLGGTIDSHRTDDEFVICARFEEVASPTIGASDPAESSATDGSPVTDGPPVTDGSPVATGSSAGNGPSVTEGSA